ncbi:TonB family protein [Lentisalinibacter sediminis]|uniref:TonB family protein n=1 Tax=Lentisalinibacter sediminis TaxID=2992237 RepID=UPI00386A7263
MQRFKTQVLLLHSEQSTLDRFSASLGDAYSVHLATSGTEALNTLGLTPIHVMVSAQRLPGMSGIEALREARKRSPETLGILIAPEDMSGAEAEALVGSEALFQVIRGIGTPEDMRRVIDEAVDQLRLNTLQDSANDRSAGPRPRVSPTAPSREAGPAARRAAPGVEASGTFPAAAGTVAATELVVLSKDEVFLDTIRQALSPRQPVHAVDDLRAAAKLVGDARSAVLITDAAVAPRDVEAITTRLRSRQPGLVTIVAGRRDDGDQLMDLINAGMVYRFLLKPISPGRARLAIEAAIRRAQEKAKAAAPAAPAPSPLAPPTPGARVEPTIADFEGAEEVVLSEEAPATRTPPLRPETPPPAVTKPKVRRKEPKAKAPEDQTKAEVPAENAGGGGLSRPALLAGAGALLALITVGGIWSLSGGPDEGAATSPAGTSAGASAPAADPAGEARAEPPAPPPVSRDLRRARQAVAAGRLLAPGEDGALALYATALAQAPNDAALAAEVEQVVAEAVATVAAALDAGRPGEARAARSVIRASFPAAPGLEIIDTRLAVAEQDRLVARADELAGAGDTARAMEVLDEAAALLPGRSPAVAARRESILAAADDRGRTLLLELGNQRLLQDQLVEPAVDNARYYYRAVLSQDSDSIAGRQGMAFLRTALITRIRESVEAGDRAAAELWLEEASLSGVEEPRLAPFREAAARLPSAPAPAAQTRAPQPAPDPESDPESDPAPEPETRGEPAASAEPLAVDDSAPVVEESAVPAVAPAAQEQGALASEERAPEPMSEAMSETASEAMPEDTGPPADTSEVAETTEASDTAAATPSADSAVAADDPDTTTDPGAAGPREPAVSREETVPEETPPATRPERITYVPPEYPRVAQMRSLEGWVDVEFSLTPAGRPTDIRVTDASPAGTFDEAAIGAVDQWRYEPLAAADWPAGERIRIRINFGIDP